MQNKIIQKRQKAESKRQKSKFGNISVKFNLSTLTARHWVPDGRDGLQIWRAAANIQNRECGQPTRGVSPAWGLKAG
jgi:hypothetical protein